MQITNGTRLGPYEVVAPIGAGGMGEVYRARDTRLDRSVAVKVLPPRIAGDPGRRERFEREARAISGLAHPNICTLFDIGEHDGTAYLVMELLDGQTLADRIARGPLPLDQVLRIGAEIAQALARAHRHGIVHRDLKPGNVMLTKSGAKLLDFGLARNAQQGTIAPDAPTVHAAPLTTEGTILGTLPYMAPEQLESRPTDGRTDLFALGAVLYEMLTGRRAFDATSQASLITKIMSEQPVPVRELQPITPAALERVITKCLAKDPDERWQCADDVASELRWIAEGTAVIEAAQTARRASWIPWAIAIAGVVAAIALGIVLLRKPAPVTRTVRFAVLPPANATFNIAPGFPVCAVSPDGAKIAFATREAHAAGRLFVYDLATGQSQPVDGTQKAYSPFWSPDGRSLGFMSGHQLNTVSLESKTVQKVCDLGTGDVSAAWLNDDTILFTQLTITHAVMAVPASGGTPRAVASVAKPSDVDNPERIDGRHFFFTEIRDRETAVWVGDVAGGTPVRVAERAGRFSYDPPYVTFVRDGTLFAQRFDERALRLEGAPVTVNDAVWFYRAIGLSQHAARGDTLAIASPLLSRKMVWIDRGGKELGPALPESGYRGYFRIAPDGKSVVTCIDDPKILNGDVWIGDLQRKSLSRVTFGDHDYDTPVWSPDGKTIAYGEDQGGPPFLFARPYGGGAERRITTPQGIQWATDWLHDGRVLLHIDGATSGTDIYLSKTNAIGQEPWLATPADEGSARISPDQRFVTYASNDSGRFEIYVAPLDRPGEHVRISDDGGSRPVWSRDGREVYWLHGSDVLAAPVRMNGSSIEGGAPSRVYTAQSSIIGYDVAPDGRLLLAIASLAPNTSPLTVITGWKKLVEKPR